MAISITKPQIGGSENTWGDEINDALDVIVDAVNGTTGTTSPNLSSFSVDGTVVTATATELNLLSGVTGNLSYVNGVTGDIQTQLDGRAELSGANFTGAVDVNAAVSANSLVLDNGADDWTFEVSANKLIIKYSGTAKMELDTSGNLKVTGNVTAYGTI
jgi:hypothetical protein